jgi:CARDB
MRVRHTAFVSGSLGLVAGLVGASIASSAGPQVSASVESCRHSSADRSATFVADMHAISRTRTMAIRFDLRRQRARGQSWSTVHAAGLGEWHRSEANVDIFRYRKLVTNLVGPANYRAVARYRWYDAGGAVIARARRTTGTCRQPDRRPDLVAADLEVQPGPNADRQRYVVTLANNGKQAAGPFDAILYVDGTREGSITVPDLSGRARQAITIEGSRCGIGSSVLVVLDPEDQVDEARETNNTTRFSCPL